jgi:hypothetical protein
VKAYQCARSGQKVAPRNFPAFLRRGKKDKKIPAVPPREGARALLASAVRTDNAEGVGTKGVFFLSSTACRRVEQRAFDLRGKDKGIICSFVYKYTCILNKHLI